MKKLLFLSIFAVVTAISWVACSKEEVKAPTAAAQEPQELYTSFKYSKDVRLTDDKGNEALVQVSSNNQEYMDAKFPNLKLVASYKSNVPTNSTPQTARAAGKPSIAERWAKENVEVIDIFVKEYKFASDVTGFHVEVLPRDERSWDVCKYQYATIGSGPGKTVSGYKLSYDNDQNCSPEDLEVDFAWVNSCYFCTYTNVSNQILSSVGGISTYDGKVERYKWRIRWDFENCNSADRANGRTWEYLFF